MKAIVCDRYGTPEVLRLEEVERPAPRDNQVLVKVHASSLNAADFEILGGHLSNAKSKFDDAEKRLDKFTDKLGQLTGGKPTELIEAPEAKERG